MHIVYEGQAYFFAGSPVIERRSNKPHIAKRFGHWYNSGNGEFKPRIEAMRYCERHNKEIDNESLR